MANDLELQPPPRVTSQDRLLALVQAKYPQYHPVVAMVNLAHTTEDEGIELNCHKEVAKYVVAVDRFVEVKSEIKQTKRVVVELFGGPDQPRAVAHDPSHVLEATDVVDVPNKLEVPKASGVSTVVDQLAVRSETEQRERRETWRSTGPVEAEPEEPRRSQALLGAWGDGSGGGAERFT